MKEYRTEINNIKLSDEKKEEIKGLYRRIHAEDEKKAAVRNFRGLTSVRNTALKCLAAGVAAACVIVAVKGVASGITSQSTSVAESTQPAAVNSFTVIFNSQELANGVTELTKGVTALTSKGYGGSVSVSGNSDKKCVSYSIRVPLQCSGDNISKVTYSVNNGAFRVVEKLDNRVVVGGVSCSGMNVPGGSKGENYTENFYTMFTLDYGNQGTDTTLIYICNVVNDDDLSIMDNIWAEQDTDLSRQAAGYAQMLGDTVITCIVEYADGSAEEKQIQIGNTVTTWNELGQPERAKENADEPIHFVTYTLKDDAKDSSYVVSGKFVKPSGYKDYDVVALSVEGSAQIAKNEAVKAANKSGSEEKYYNDKRLAEEARPSGTEYTGMNTALSVTWLSTKLSAANGVDNSAAKTSLSTPDSEIVESGFYIYNTNDNIAFEKCDVMSYSFSLYEDIQDMAVVKFSLYGVTQENMDGYLYTKDKMGFIDYDTEAAYADYLAGNNTMTLIGSWNVEKTGVYYVDFSAVPDADSYVDYVIVVNVDNYSDELSFRISADYTYDITNAAEFAKWKQEHTDMFFE